MRNSIAISAEIRLELCNFSLGCLLASDGTLRVRIPRGVTVAGIEHSL
jgi:hypothetical protein